MSQGRSSNGVDRTAGVIQRLGRQLIVYHADGQFVSTVNPSAISQIVKQKDSFVWLDLQDPQAHDIDLLRDEFHFHQLAIEDATRHHERPKLEAFEGYHFIVFYGISYDTARRRVDTQAINLFVGQNYLVSVHQGTIGAIDQTIKRWQANEEDFGRDASAARPGSTSSARQAAPPRGPTAQPQGGSRARPRHGAGRARA
jgi:hypothetical protein